MALELSHFGTCRLTWPTEGLTSATRRAVARHDPFADLLAALAAESDRLFGLLANVPASWWDLPTASGPPAIRDRVAQLAFLDDATLLAATDPDEFRQEAEKLTADGTPVIDAIIAPHRPLTIRTLLAWAIDSRRQLALSLKAEMPDRLVGSFGPDITVESAVRHRLDETRALRRDLRDLTLAPDTAPNPLHQSLLR